MKNCFSIVRKFLLLCSTGLSAKKFRTKTVKQPYSFRIFVSASKVSSRSGSKNRIIVWSKRNFAIVCFFGCDWWSNISNLLLYLKTRKNVFQKVLVFQKVHSTFNYLVDSNFWRTSQLEGVRTYFGLLWSWGILSRKFSQKNHQMKRPHPKLWLGVVTSQLYII